MTLGEASSAVLRVYQPRSLSSAVCFCMIDGCRSLEAPIFRATVNCDGLCREPIVTEFGGTARTVESKNYGEIYWTQSTGQSSFRRTAV